MTSTADHDHDRAHENHSSHVRFAFEFSGDALTE